MSPNLAINEANEQAHLLVEGLWSFLRKVGQEGRIGFSRGIVDRD